MGNYTIYDEGIIYDKGIISIPTAKQVIDNLVQQLTIADLPITYKIYDEDTDTIVYSVTYRLYRDELTKEDLEHEQAETSS